VAAFTDHGFFCSDKVPPRANRSDTERLAPRCIFAPHLTSPRHDSTLFSALNDTTLVVEDSRQPFWRDAKAVVNAGWGKEKPNPARYDRQVR